MSHEQVSRKPSTNLTPAEHLALEIERRASAVPRPSSSLLPPDTRESLESEGYPSWLPRRPHPPGPVSPSYTDGDGRAAGDIRTSAEDSSSGSPEQFATMQSSWKAPKDGRNPTPRSVRILAVPADHDDPAGLVARSSGLAFAPSVGHDPTIPATVSRDPVTGLPRPADNPRPRFRANGFHPKILRNPSRLNRIHFFLQPLLVFAHIPIQAFFDFNAAYILLQAARHPTPEAPGVPVSGRNWALACAAYLGCYFVYFFSVFIGYELVYSFYRRWRAKRPLILPIYLSARAFELVSMTSYTNFCFLHHIRANAFRRSQNGSLRDGFAETCYRYSQNLPTVVLLLPRAALCLAALLSFSDATPAAIQATAGPSPRDRTFFNADGSLTSYARGILITNAAWAMWRVFVLLASWLGLWILSGQGCAGLCGPRYRWEEEDDEKSSSPYSRSREDALIDRWAWLPYTIARVQDTYDFCLTTRAKRRSLTGSTRSRSLPPMTEVPSASLPTSGTRTARPSAAPSAEALASTAPQGAFLSIDEMTPAPSVPIAGSSLPSTRRNMLEPGVYPGPSSPVAASSLVPPTPSPLQSLVPVYDSAKPGQGTGSRSGPVLTLPFPFYPASAPSFVPSSSLPFPLQPTGAAAESTTASSSPLGSFDDEEEYVVRDSDTDEIGVVQLPTSVEHPDDSLEPRVSLERGSGSLSSLGQPMSSRYPFEYQASGQGSRTPSSGSRKSPHPKSPSSHTNSLTWSSHRSRSSPRESFRVEGSSGLASPIDPPPRHPSVGSTAGRRRRAGTAPSLSSSPLPSEDSGRGRTVSVTDQTFGVHNPLPPVQGTHDEEHDFEEDFEFESGEELALGSQEEAEKEDSVGLLSTAPSPKSSIAALRARASSLVSAQGRASSFRSGSGHPSRSPSSSSTRSRAVSLVPAIGRTQSFSSLNPPQKPAAETSAHSSRSRASSAARGTAESMSRYSDAQSHISPTQEGDDDTFGAQPLPINWDDVPRRGVAPEASRPSGTTSSLQIPIPRGGRGVRPSASRMTSASQQTVSQGPARADISEAPSSYVTAAPTFLETTTEGSGGTIRTMNPWGDPSNDVM